jgi:hypothetical protein
MTVETSIVQVEGIGDLCRGGRAGDSRDGDELENLKE